MQREEKKLKTDTRILDLIKAHDSKAAQNAETAARKAMDDVFQFAPKESVENFNYWLLMNYYTYEIVESFFSKLEQSKKSERL